MRLFFLTAVLALGLIADAPAARAAVNPADAQAAVAVVNGFHDSLLATMKDGEKLGYKGRFDHLAPPVEKAFNLPFMTRFIMGPNWNSLDSDKQQAMLESFRRFTIGTYAGHFDTYDGEQFVVAGDPQEQKENLLVPTRLVEKKGDGIKLNYLLHKGEHGWQVIDVFMEGTVSELATQRSASQSVLTANGVDGLIAQLDKKTADLGTAPTVAQP